MKNINDYLLTSDVTVGQVKRLMANKDNDAKEKLIGLIHHRFYNRYIKHGLASDSGFLIMAISCLMVETIQSFKEGMKDTNGHSKDMFRNFFKEERTHFPGFFEITTDFYTNIRCGIIHQAETNNGWRILRSGRLLDKDAKAINAKSFIVALERSLNAYTNALRRNDFSNEIWINSISKLEDVCDNCRIKY